MPKPTSGQIHKMNLKSLVMTGAQSFGLKLSVQIDTEDGSRILDTSSNLSVQIDNEHEGIIAPSGCNPGTKVLRVRQTT